MDELHKPALMDTEDQLQQPSPTTEWQNLGMGQNAGTGPGLDHPFVRSAFGAHITVEHTAFWTLSNLYAVQVVTHGLYPMLGATHLCNAQFYSVYHKAGSVVVMTHPLLTYPVYTSSTNTSREHAYCCN